MKLLNGMTQFQLFIGGAYGCQITHISYTLPNYELSRCGRAVASFATCGNQTNSIFGAIFANKVFALRNHARCFIQRVSAADFGDVKLFATQHCLAFVARHMQPHGIRLGITTDKIINRRYHTSFSASCATLIMMAHSMRLRKSSQPGSYTPRMEPEAWKALAAQPPEQYSLAQQSLHSSRA